MVSGQNEGGSEGKLTLFCRFKDTPKYRQWGFAGNYARLSRVSPRTKKHSRDKTTAIDVSMKTSWLLQDCCCIKTNCTLLSTLKRTSNM